MAAIGNYWRFDLRRPHALVSFDRLARMLEVASNLDRLACGLDSDQRSAGRPGPQ